MGRIRPPTTRQAAKLAAAFSLHQAGLLDEAADEYRKLLRASPGHPLLLTNLGLIAFNQRQLDEGVRLIGASLAADPRQPDALTNRGLALLELGRPEDALADFDRAIALDAGLAEAHHHRGLALLRLGRHEQAVAAFERAIALGPDDPGAHHNCGNALNLLGRHAAALTCFERAIALAADDAASHSGRGNALRALGRLDEALAACDRAIALRPELAEAHLNRAIVLHDLLRHDEALASVDRAILLDPGYAEAHHTRGNLLQALGRLGESLGAFDRAIEIRPDFAAAWSGRGLTLQATGRLDAAMADFDRALALNPAFAPAWWNKALLLILRGDYREGWRLYEWRWQDWLADFARNFVQPRWSGDLPLAGRTLLIHAEQGYGDTIQFCRYALLAEARGARVILEVPAALSALLATLPGQVAVVEKGRALPAFDLHCPLMSLPHAFATTLDTVPAPLPYLGVDNGRRQVWQQRFGTRNALRVGLAWSGSPAHTNDRNRSLDFARLQPLLALPCEFHLLQKEVRPAEQAMLAASPGIRDHRQQLGDFADTAALIAELDLVITVDTAIAHVAGALGKRVWILLPFMPDYRWGLGREDTPWYPTARLFRQPAIGDWTAVINAVRGQLAGLANAGPDVAAALPTEPAT